MSSATQVTTRPTGADGPGAPGPTSDASRFRLWLPKGKLYMALYLIMLPTLASMAVFGYYPKIDVVIMSLFRWQPPMVEEFIGFRNFVDVFNDPLFWQSFELVGILLVANLVKMWPSIFAAVALHRLPNARHRYVYQVMFVIPMVIPGLVWLLVWKSFYDPDFGVLNRILNLTGGMQVMQFLDTAMPKVAGVVNGLADVSVNVVFGSAWGLLLIAGMVMTLARMSGGAARDRVAAYGPILALNSLPLLGVLTGLAHTWYGFMGLAAAAAYCLFMIGRRLGGGWVVWGLWFLGALLVFRGDPWLLPLLLAVAMAGCELVRAKFDRFAAGDMIHWTGMLGLAVGCAVVLLGMIWTEPTGQFVEGTPAWLGSQDLVIPAVLFWGFPWVGTVGVLIYLSGLQQISQDVYEAAELDGVGPVGMLFKIELPLIMTQVRINLIFMTIGTLTAYEFFLLLLGPSGGPGNKGMVPGLYMFKKAFEDGRFGYACALGMVMFVVILILTVIYNKYVKVEK